MKSKSKEAKLNLGKYTQNGAPIVWTYVENAANDNIVYLALEGVTVYPFRCLSKERDDNISRYCYYQDSDLRDWLNSDFLKQYFTSEERMKIKEIRIPSIDEINKWLPKCVDRVCFPSMEAQNNGAEVFHSYDDKSACVYWLADSGRKVGMSATVVMANGQIYNSAYLSAVNVCVRPVIELWGEKEVWD